MTKSTVASWDTTASLNTDIGGINIDEGCPAPNINNAVREIMAQIKTLSPVGGGAVQRNLWVNTSFEVSAENGNTLGTTNGYFAADQLAMYFTASTAAMSVQRIQVRTLANSTNQIEFKCTTAKPSLGAADFVTLTQPIEGSAIAACGFGTAAAVPLVMRFEVSLPAGTYHFHFQNSAANRHCAVPFTIVSGEANTAVVKTIIVPADTSGTWLTADGVIGLVCDLVLAAGASLTGGTASTWGATTYYAATTQFNILSANTNVARLADVGLKLDPNATGVYGIYRAGETDARYNSNAYYMRDYVYFTAFRSGSEVNGYLGGSFQIPKMCKTPSYQVATDAGFVEGEGIQAVYPSAGTSTFSQQTPRGGFMVGAQAASGTTLNVPWRAKALIVASARLS